MFALFPGETSRPSTCQESTFILTWFPGGGTPQTPLVSLHSGLRMGLFSIPLVSLRSGFRMKISLVFLVIPPLLLPHHAKTRAKRAPGGLGGWAPRKEGHTSICLGFSLLSWVGWEQDLPGSLRSGVIVLCVLGGAQDSGIALFASTLFCP
jgi:hypothetical protein